VLHTPGGDPNAAETIVSYLRSKFDYIEVIVPALAMSAGTMISLAADLIVLGRQSQLGPIDPQIPFGGRYVSARAIVDQFEQAKLHILGNPAAGIPQNLDAGHVWAPILQASDRLCFKRPRTRSTTASRWWLAGWRPTCSRRRWIQLPMGTRWRDTSTTLDRTRVTGGE
jgi:hypothetical protein